MTIGNIIIAALVVGGVLCSAALVDNGLVRPLHLRRSSRKDYKIFGWMLLFAALGIAAIRLQAMGVLP